MDKTTLANFKNLTGCNISEIGRRFGFTRQYAYQLVNNSSPTHKASAAFLLTTIVNEKIAEHKSKIEELEVLRHDIQEDAFRRCEGGY
mgnify:CR=1 FL=1